MWWSCETHLPGGFAEWSLHSKSHIFVLLHDQHREARAGGRARGGTRERSTGHWRESTWRGRLSRQDTAPGRARRSRLGFGEVVGHSTRERRGDSDAMRRAKERRRSTAPGREDSGKAEGHSTRNRDVRTRREAVRDLHGERGGAVAPQPYRITQQFGCTRPPTHGLSRITSLVASSCDTAAVYLQ